jgi:hypothetical protein
MLAHRQKKVIYILLALVGVLFLAMFARLSRVHHPFDADHVLESTHYRVESRTTIDNTKQALEVAEALFSAYTGYMDSIGFKPTSNHKKHELRLYRSRKEFKQFNKATGLAEAYYFNYVCYQYIDAQKTSSYHWMLHEATHQLNREYSRLKLKRWLEEGIACYFGTSKYSIKEPMLGDINLKSYPIWYLTRKQLSSKFDEDVKSGQIIPLKNIISGIGGPKMESSFNNYYCHWFSIVHFFNHFQNGKYKVHLSKLIRKGGSLSDFETIIGPLDKVEKEWYSHFLQLVKMLQEKRKLKMGKN